jgi:glycosyltransferase involved in cell wall biosynthesis
MNSPRILWLTEYYYPNRGGMATSCDRMVAGLRKSGLEIDVVHFTDRLPAFTHRAENGGNYMTIEPVEDLPHTLNLAWRFIEQKAQNRPYTHVLSFGGSLSMSGGPVFAAWMGLPFVLCLRGNDWDVGIFTPKRMPVLERAIDRAAVVCCVSHEKKMRVQALWPHKKVVFTPNGLDSENWQPLPSHLSKARAWRASKVAEGKRVLGLFGALKAKKGMNIVLDALDRPRLKEQVFLLLVGELEKGAEDQIRERGLDFEHIPFLDRYELLAWYPACDGIALPSWYDGMPNVVLEAMALGIPVLGSEVDGIRDVVSPVSPELLFPPGNISACRKAIKQWLKMGESDLAELAPKLTQHIRQNFSPEMEAANYVRVFTSTLKTNSVPTNTNF